MLGWWFLLIILALPVVSCLSVFVSWSGNIWLIILSILVLFYLLLSSFSEGTCLAHYLNYFPSVLSLFFNVQCLIILTASFNFIFVFWRCNGQLMNLTVPMLSDLYFLKSAYFNSVVFYFFFILSVCIAWLTILTVFQYLLKVQCLTANLHFSLILSFVLVNF